MNTRYSSHGKNGDMTDEEKMQFNAMQGDMRQIKTQLGGLSNTVGTLTSELQRLCIGLMGSDITKDGGMVARLIDVEKEQVEIKDEMQKLKDAAKETAWKTALMWAMAGILALAAFNKFLSMFHI